MVWSVNVDMSNEALKEEVLNAFSDASENKSLLDRFTMFERKDMPNVFFLTTKDNQRSNFADYDKIQKIVDKYPPFFTL
ncbi:MAG: hypothetical protein VX740_02800 [Pseudomonadota bacterium]|jgi:hypothetical protein|nr:hypothetical protein [Alphaproteobacteria bacterium]MEC7702494.1 hypothetical protein [Pseudomonadota bacterium]MCS5597489.1 hypothetical protein [Alphaproteobacteria bacterium]MEC9234939.1 hypothetical protein [Pseudomonadota bacterium]MED5422347.1 hypothetical protein [Pseudomonadota bacterium]|tara:strand:- start:58 stop:294 length:237 start_codon:yes stop_codon:yes gene_type:complete